jgi:plasmid stability protein
MDGFLTALLALPATLSLLARSCYSSIVATITIRNLDEKVKRALQVRAAINGRSMEAEAREFLSEMLEGRDFRDKCRKNTVKHVDIEVPFRNFEGRDADERTERVSSRIQPKEGLGTMIHKLFAPLGGVEIQIPTRRKSHRPIPTFE